MSKTGVSLDHEFCVKAVSGMLGEMEKNPDRFAGKRVLFMHSGKLTQHCDDTPARYINILFVVRWCLWFV